MQDTQPESLTPTLDTTTPPLPTPVGRAPSFLLLGPPGSGKTVLACSAPGRKYLVDMDAKADEMSLLEPMVASGELTIRPLLSPLMMDTLRTRAITAVASKPYQNEPTGYLEFCALVSEMATLGKDHDVWIIDPLNRVGEHLSRYIAYSNKVASMRPRDYGTYLKMMEEVIDKLRKTARKMGKILICTIHQRYLEEPQADTRVTHQAGGQSERTGTGVMRQMPALEGQIASKLAGFFSEAYICRTVPDRGGRVKYIVQTVPDEMSDARTSRNLPPFFQGTLADVLNNTVKPAQ
jgi:AAA domain